MLVDLNDDFLYELRKILSNTKLFQVFVSPTKVTTDSATLLDDVINNIPDINIESDSFPCSIADHDLICHH